MDGDLRFLLIVYGPIVSFVYLLILLDWIGRRDERKANKQKPA
jgi:hypothetical protein